MKEIYELKLVRSIEQIHEAVTRLENELQPTLSARNINLKCFSEKLLKYGMTWCYYCEDKPISIIAGYINDKLTFTSYISILAVSSEFRHAGLGTSLLKAFEEFSVDSGMKKSKLEVRKSNIKAQIFYKKNGYKFIVESTPDSFFMEKELEI